MEEGKVIAERFELERRVGRGAMASVHRAIDRRSGETVAVKVASRSERAQARARREAALLAALDHPGVVRYVSHGETVDGDVWLAMEWVQGHNLASRHERDALDLPQAVSVAARAAEALAGIHAVGVVHRDVTPSNLLLTGSGDDVRLIDFGVAVDRAHPEGAPAAGELVGTPRYMSPEQALGARDIGPASDVYALAAVLFELLAGRPPFDASSPMALLGRIVLEPPPRLRELRRGLPLGIDVLLGRALSKEPEDRPSAAELASELGSMPLRPSIPLPRSSSKPPAATVDVPAEEERRVLVVLLAGLPGGVPMPEPMTESLSAAAGASALSRRLRDGTFVAAFGGTHARGDEVVAAARLALGAQRLHPMLRFAIATGFAEPDAHGEPTGEALERAAGALETGERGEIVLDPASATLLGGRFRVAWDGERALLREEVDEAQSPPRVLGRRSPFVGRGRELGLALGVYREALEERAPRLVTITGEPGTGKSRLRAELLAELARHAEPPAVVYCRGDAPTGDVAYAAVGRALRRACNADEASTREARRLVTVEGLGATLPASVRDEVVPFLAELAEVHLPDSEAPALRAARHDPLLMRERVRNAFVAWVQASASVRPLALVVEDAHHADVDSLWLIEAALQEASDVAVFAILVGRDGTELPAGLREQVTRLVLGPLPQRAAERVVRADLPQAEPHTVRDIVARSGGNPLFLEELVRTVGEEESDELPATVQAVVQTRLDRLPRNVRLVARAASVFGEAFWRQSVEHLLPDTDVQSALSILEHHEIVSRRSISRVPGAEEWTFPAPVFREVAYHMLAPRERQRLHGLAAQWLERVVLGEDATVAPHLDRAGATAEAARRYVGAAVRAMGAGALDAVVRSATRALELGVDGDARTRALLTRCEARLRLADHEGAAEDGLAVAAERGAGPALRILGYGFAGSACRRQGKLLDALALLDAALEVEATDEGARLARLKARVWRCSALADAGRADEASREIAELCDVHSDHPDPFVRCAMAEVRGYVAFVRADLATMLNAEREALERARRLDDSVRTAQALDLLAQALLRMGRVEEALEHARKGARLARISRAAGVEAALRLTAGAARARLGAVAEGLADVEAALATADRLDIAGLRVSTRAHLALIFVDRRHDGDARRALEHAGAAAELEPPDAPTAGLVAHALGRALLASGQAVRAERVLRAHAERTHPCELPVRLAHRDALAVLGREREANEAVARAAARLEEMAASLGDPELERAFRAIPHHRRLVELAETVVGTALQA